MKNKVMDIIYCHQETLIPDSFYERFLKIPSIFFLSKLSTHFVVVLILLLFPADIFALLSLSGKLNINTASKTELMLLPEIGEVRSALIVAYREKRGEFKGLESLVDVKGLGKKTLESVKKHIKISGRSDLSIVDNISSLTKGKTVEKFSEGRLTLLGNESFYLNLIASIKKAEKSIDISMFLFKTSKYASNRANILLEALASASERGVKVSLLLEKSAKKKDNVTFVNKKSALKLLERGVNVLFDGVGSLTHTKTVVIDGKISFIGSHNFTHSALKYNNELSLRVDSEQFGEKVLKYIEGLK